MVSTKFGLAFAIGILLLASVQGQCTPTCDTTGGDCVGTTCYCNAGYYGADCSTTCSPACTGSEVCTGAASCGPCDPVCAGTGTCAAVDTTPTCKCNTGYFGDDCAQQYCPANKCKNGGTCNPADGTCTCTTDWTGLTCETAKCTGNPDCLNGGTCTSDVCVCAPGWDGDLCDVEVLVCEPACETAQKCVEEDGSNVCKTKCADNAACLNGGTCANELCNCAEGWTGDLCADSGVSSVVPSVLSMALFMLVLLL